MDTADAFGLVGFVVWRLAFLPGAVETEVGDAVCAMGNGGAAMPPLAQCPMPALSCCCTTVRRDISWSICCSLASSRCMTLSTCMSCACTCSSSGLGVTSVIRPWTWSIASLWCFRRSALWLWAWIVCQSSCFSVPTSPSHTSSSFAILLWRSDFRSPLVPGSIRATRSEMCLIFSPMASILALTFWISLPTLDSDWCLASRIMISTC
mmetsp:Transcript_5527/g.12545  ORF Transcript_5527/g.12545 Transcript_5527/m.12545 type:complete len:208 (-) Transcript_5527:177-800(-)